MNIPAGFLAGMFLFPTNEEHTWSVLSSDLAPRKQAVNSGLISKSNLILPGKLCAFIRLRVELD